MRPSVIRQPHGAALSPAAGGATPFAWEQIGRELGITPGGTVNIAQLTVDRHAASARGDQPAFRSVNADGGRRSLTYRELARLTDRFGNALKSLGVGKGDCVFVLCGRRCELYVAVLGALKVGAVVSPLLPAFGPEPIRNRMAQANGKVLVTTANA